MTPDEARRIYDKLDQLEGGLHRRLDEVQQDLRARHVAETALDGRVCALEKASDTGSNRRWAIIMAVVSMMLSVASSVTAAVIIARALTGGG